MTEKISISVTITASMDEVWTKWTGEEHIVKWYFASDDWHCPSVSNNLEVGGEFVNRMEAKDGSFGFDFRGKYTAIENHKLIAYVLEDDRTVDITFDETDKEVSIVCVFEAEDENPKEMQRDGWQAILNHFKEYVEKR